MSIDGNYNILDRISILFDEKLLLRLYYEEHITS